MRNNNLLKILVGLLFAAGGIGLLWQGWRILGGDSVSVIRTGPVILWVIGALVWGWLLRFAIHHYRNFN